MTDSDSTRNALDKLLARFDPDRQRAGERYEAFRRRLLFLFTLWRCPEPEEQADETFDRVARRVDEGAEIAGAGGVLLSRGAERAARAVAPAPIGAIGRSATGLAAGAGADGGTRSGRGRSDVFGPNGGDEVVPRPAATRETRDSLSPTILAPAVSASGVGPCSRRDWGYPGETLRAAGLPHQGRVSTGRFKATLDRVVAGTEALKRIGESAHESKEPWTN